MVICGGYMLCVSKDMKSMLHMRGGSRGGSGTFMSNINRQGIENWC